MNISGNIKTWQKYPVFPVFSVFFFPPRVWFCLKNTSIIMQKLFQQLMSSQNSLKKYHQKYLLNWQNAPKLILPLKIQQGTVKSDQNKTKTEQPKPCSEHGNRPRTKLFFS